MKNDDLPRNVCSPGVLAVDTHTQSVFQAISAHSAADRTELPSLTTRSFGPRGACARRTSPWTMRLTDRDCAFVEYLLRMGALYAVHFRVLMFSRGAASRCQRRLTLLVHNHYLETLEGRRANEPAVYVLGPRSVEGYRLLRERLGEDEVRRARFRLGPIPHLLAVNDVRVRVERACRDLGWLLANWQRPDELAPLMAADHLVPDAYFRIRRVVDGQEKTAAFFLELERVGKSSQVAASKLKRYGDFYYSGRYEQVFGTRALRVLFVFVGADRQNARRAQKAAEEAKRQGVTIARFAYLDTLKNLMPAGSLTEPVWQVPDGTHPMPLFDWKAPAGSV